MLGKPVGQDKLNERPSSAQALGLEGAIAHFDFLIAQATSSIPDCASKDMLKHLVLLESQRLVPKSMCEEYRKRVASAQPYKARTPQKNTPQQQQFMQ